MAAQWQNPDIIKVAIAAPVRRERNAAAPALPPPIDSKVAEYLFQFEHPDEPRVKLEDNRPGRDDRHKQNPVVPLDRLQIIIDEANKAKVDPLRVLAIALHETNVSQDNPMQLNVMPDSRNIPGEALAIRSAPTRATLETPQWQDPANATATGNPAYAMAPSDAIGRLREQLLARIGNADAHTPEGEALLRADIQAAIAHMQSRAKAVGGPPDRQLKAYNGMGKGGDPHYVSNIKSLEGNLATNRAIIAILNKARK